MDLTAIRPQNGVTENIFKAGYLQMPLNILYLHTEKRKS